MEDWLDRHASYAYGDGLLATLWSYTYSQETH